MSELSERLKEEFRDKETRHIYAEDFLNTYIATQLKVLREDREWTQAKVGEETGMAQERICVLEDVNYDSWSVRTLKRFAKAFDLRLSIKFETFGSFLNDFETFNRESLSRPSFEEDPAFADSATETTAKRQGLKLATNADLAQASLKQSTAIESKHNQVRTVKRPRRRYVRRKAA